MAKTTTNRPPVIPTDQPERKAKFNNLTAKGIYISLDISTSCIGVSVFDERGELLDLTHLRLEADRDVLVDYRYIPKANHFREFITKYRANNIHGVFIEEPLSNTNQKTSRDTTNKLLRFNGICCYIIHQELCVVPELISVYDVRFALCPELRDYNVKEGKWVLQSGNKKKKTGMYTDATDAKMYIFKKISKLYPDVKWVYDKKGLLHKYSLDMSDALAVGLAKLMQHEVLKKI